MSAARVFTGGVHELNVLFLGFSNHNLLVLPDSGQMAGVLLKELQSFGEWKSFVEEFEIEASRENLRASRDRTDSCQKGLLKLQQVSSSFPHEFEWPII